MSRLFPGRRSSTTVSTLLKKPSHIRQQTPDKGVQANVASSSGSAPQQAAAQSPLAPFISKLQEKQAIVLLQKLEDKLPCNSGLPLSDVEGDQIIVVDGIAKLAASCSDFIVWSLCSILEKLQKRAFPDGTLPEEVLDSQLFILKTLAQTLSARRPYPSPSTLGDDSSLMSSDTTTHTQSPSNSASASSLSPEFIPPPVVHEPKSSTMPSNISLHSNSTSSSLIEPPPLDDKTVHYALDVVRMVQRCASSSMGGAGTTEMYAWHVVDQDPILSVPIVQKGRKKGLRGTGKVTDLERESATGKETDKGQMDEDHTTYSLHSDPSSGANLVQDAGIRPVVGWSQYAMYTHIYACDEALHGSYFANVMVLFRRYANSVVYRLSTSNWPVVFDRLKTRLLAMAERDRTVISLSPSHSQPLGYPHRSPDARKACQSAIGGIEEKTDGKCSDAADEGDLELLSACLMDRTRLLAVLQAFLSVFREMPTASQGTASLALRNAVLNWAENFPQEFMELWTPHIPQSGSASVMSGSPDTRVYSSLSASGLAVTSLVGVGEQRRKSRQLEGVPGHVFDMLNDSNRDGNRRAAILYPALAALICISPDRLETANGALEGTMKVSSKNNLLALLMHSLTSSSTSKMAMSEQSFFACFEIARFAFFIPPPLPGAEEPSLRTIGANMALELKNFLMRPSIPRLPFYASKDPIDVNFHAYCIAAIFRFHPEHALKDLIEVCLEPERSQAVKLSVVRALVLLVTEAPKYPWQPSLELVFPVVTPRLRSILTSCTASQSEVINGLRRPPSPFPPCKLVAVARRSDGNLANVIDDNLRLRVQIETLFPLEPRFWLYGSTDADHSFLLSHVGLEQHRDKPERAATVMALGATLMSSLDISPGAPCYEEAMRYLLITAPAIFVNAALLIIHAINDHELLRMGISIMHTMLTQLALGSRHNQDESWRFSPHMIEAISLMEFSSWCCVTSSQVDIVTTAQRCIRLLSIIERNPAFPRPPYLSDGDFSRRATVVESMGSPQIVIGGRIAIQKRIRQMIAMSTAPTPVQVMVFHETMTRFLELTRQVEPLPQNQRSDQSVSGKASSDQLHEWQNVMYMVAVGSRTWMAEKMDVFPEHILSLLPPRFQGRQRQPDMINQFIEELLRLLCSENLTVRQSAKEALGKELNIKLMPILFNHLDRAIQKQLVGPQEDVIQSSLLFAEQCLMVMKMILEHTDTTVFDNDVPGNCISIGHFISCVPANTHTMRLRALYCSTVNLLLVKRHCFAIRKENDFRNRLAEILADWIEQHLDLTIDDSRATEIHRAASDAQIAALKLFVLSAETLRVQSSEQTSSSDPIHIIPRDHHRYLVTLMKIFVPVKELSEKASDFDRGSKKSADTLNNEELAHELVVSGIAHLLNNNSELYKRFCLERCYDPDIRLRVVFMKAFTRVLNLGTQFDQPHGNTPTDSRCTLCQVVRDCKTIALSIIQVCLPNEVEGLIPVLMRVFNTRLPLVDFLKTLIDREVAGTASPSQLFRSNTICNRMLSAFARQYGYVYLRNILESLVHQMMQVPDGCSFELDPSKLPATENTKENAQTLMVITQAFVDVIVGSVTDIPPVIREICHHIAEVVSDAWPESKYHAIGAFMFLKFICPAIVSPGTVDIEISEISNPERSASTQRGLLLVAKIIQNLSNNVPFGKEAYLMVLNPFLEKNVRTVIKFLSDTHTLGFIPYENEDELLHSGCDDTDSLILYRFIQIHADKIGRALSARSEPSTGDYLKFASGKDAWGALCTILVDTGPAFESPTLSDEDTARHIHYHHFVRRHRDRNIDVLNDIFTLHQTAEGPVFVLTFAHINIDIIDFELLLYAIFKAVAVPAGKGDEFDVIFDFTSFTARSRLPNAWLRLGLGLLPLDIRQKWRSAYILNISSDAHSFLRHVFHLFSGLPVARKVTAVSSVAELQCHFPNSPTLMALSYPASLESSHMAFEHVHQQIEDRCWTSIVLHVGVDYLRIVSVRAEDLSPTLCCRTVELIYLSDVDDVYRSCEERYIVLKRSRRGPSVVFEHSNPEVLLKSIQAAKRRSVATQKAPLLPASHTSDTRAVLLAVGLLHACHNAEYVRGAAYELLTADCAYINYPFDAQIPWRGSFIPANSLAFVINFSERISTFAPSMTLDFVLQWSVGFLNATTVEKITCLQYVSPWIRNLGVFMDPSSVHFDESRLRECIRLFITITIQDAEVYPVLQRAIWMEIGKLPPAVLTIVIDELIRVAIDSESDSWRREVVADTLIPISTIHTRARVLTELRTVLSKACTKPTRSLTETVEWKTITVLSRLVLVAGHSPRLATQNQLYAPEIAHLVTMLAGAGSLSMRLSTYGIAVNLLQALHVARSDDEVVGVQLRKMLDEMTTPPALKLFGLDRRYPSSEITLLGSASIPISADSLEKLTAVLLRALDLGSPSVGLSNVWRARWMSLVSSIAFQASFYGQFRSFTILSKFTDSAIEEEAFCQMLLVLKRNILSSSQDEEASAALLRCVRMALPGLPPESRYLGSIFWLAVSIIQADQTHLYSEVLQLLRTSVETMERHGLFDCAVPTSQNPMVAVLMEARGPLWNAAAKLDQISGLSFETDFGFSLTAIIWDGVRVQAHLELLTAVLTSLLKSSIRAANPKAEKRCYLDATSMPLFLALSVCMDKEAYVRLLEEDCHISDSSIDVIAPQRDRGDAIGDSIDLDPLGFSDMRAVLLAISSLLCLEDSPLVEPPEKEIVHLLWAEFARVYPDLFVSGIMYLMEFVTPERLAHKMDTLFSPALSEAHLQAVTYSFEIIMSRGNQPTSPASTPAGSSIFSVHEDNNGHVPETSQKNTYMEMLSEIGMSGMVQTFRRWHGHKPDLEEKIEQMTACVVGLMGLILPQ